MKHYEPSDEPSDEPRVIFQDKNLNAKFNVSFIKMINFCFSLCLPEIKFLYNKTNWTNQESVVVQNIDSKSKDNCIPKQK